MNGLRDNPAALFLLAILTFTGFALGQANRLAPIEDIALRALYPAQQTIGSVGQRLGGVFGQFREIEELRQENSRLREMVDRLSVENVELQEARIENETLRRQLDFKREHSFLNLTSTNIIGQVIGRAPSNFLHSLVINAGAEDGLTEGTPVITAEGLVGQVTRVSTRSAKVLLIVDPSSSVNARIQTSRATGVVEGQVDGKLVMKFIPQGEEVHVGDIVLTSGLGGNYPSGLVIGQVSSVHQRDIDMFQRAEIRPSVKFHRLEMVMIIEDFQPIQYQRQLNEGQSP